MLPAATNGGLIRSTTTALVRMCSSTTVRHPVPVLAAVPLDFGVP